MNANEEKLQIENDELIKDNERMRKEMAEDKAEFQKMSEDMAFITKNHEAEVNLRLQFEAKLNGLHAIHRDLKAKYKRATEDIYNIEALNKEVNE